MLIHLSIHLANLSVIFVQDDKYGGNHMRGKEIEADTTTFGGRIRYARKRLGLSAEQIGKLVYKKAGSVTAWERNNSMPDMSDLDIISTALQVTTAYLFGNEDYLSAHANYSGISFKSSEYTPLAKSLANVVYLCLLIDRGDLDLSKWHGQTEAVPQDLDDVDFAFTVLDMDMAPRIMTGDTVYCKRITTYPSAGIVLVSHPLHHQATLRQVSGGILVPLNHDSDELDMNTTELFGLVVKFMGLT